MAAFYAESCRDPAAILCNFLFDFNRQPRQEGSNRFTILTNEFLEVAGGPVTVAATAVSLHSQCDLSFDRFFVSSFLFFVLLLYFARSIFHASTNSCDHYRSAPNLRVPFRNMYLQLQLLSTVVLSENGDSEMFFCFRYYICTC